MRWTGAWRNLWCGAVLVAHGSSGSLPLPGREPPQPPNNGGSHLAPSRSPHYWGAGGAVLAGLHARIESVSAKYLGTRYAADPLGEGFGPDADPLFDRR